MISTPIVNTCFSTIIAENFLNNPEPKTIAECMKHLDWNKWKETIEPELNSLKKRKMFTDVIPTPLRIFPVGFKWVFIRKRNENNEVVRYKVRLVVKGFTQRPNIDFNEIYSPVMNEIYSPILNITGNIKASTLAVDGCRDHISLWVIRFGHLHEGS
jgi:hypothetical protein